MSPSYRPSWPISGGDDYGKYRDEKRMEWARYWSSPEGLGLTQEEFDALQEQNNPWPKDVRTAVDEVSAIAEEIKRASHVEPTMLADRIAQVIKPVVEYLDSLLESLEVRRIEEVNRRREIEAETPWYFEPGVPSHVATWAGHDAFRRYAESASNAKRRDVESESIYALYSAALSLAEFYEEQDVAGIDPGTRVVELAQDFIQAWNLAKHP